MFSTVLTSLPQISYVGLFLLLIGGAIFVPLPEEITLLTAGYLVAIGVLNIWVVVGIAFVGLLLGDAALFLLARIGGSYAQKLRARVNKMGLEKTWLFAPSHPLRAVFFLRFLTGFRFIAPIYAGFEEVSWRAYLGTDILGLIIFLPIILGLGYFFHASILPFIAIFELVRHAVFLGVLALAGSGMLPVLYRTLKKKFSKKS